MENNLSYCLNFENTSFQKDENSWMQNVKKSDELEILLLLKENNYEFITNNSIGIKKSQFRPDFYLTNLQIKNLSIIVEVDEHMHKGYSCEHEINRMQSIYYDIKHISPSVLFIRYNPHDYLHIHENNSIGKQNAFSKEERQIYLLNILNEFRENKELSVLYQNNIKQKGIYVFYLFYNGFIASKINEIVFDYIYPAKQYVNYNYHIKKNYYFNILEKDFSSETISELQKISVENKKLNLENECQDDIEINNNDFNNKNDFNENDDNTDYISEKEFNEENNNDYNICTMIKMDLEIKTKRIANRYFILYYDTRDILAPDFYLFVLYRLKHELNKFEPLTFEFHLGLKSTLVCIDYGKPLDTYFSDYFVYDKFIPKIYRPHNISSFTKELNAINKNKIYHFKENKVKSAENKSSSSEDENNSNDTEKLEDQDYDCYQLAKKVINPIPIKKRKHDFKNYETQINKKVKEM